MSESRDKAQGDFQPQLITRPDKSLLNYYLLTSFLALPAFPFVFLPLYFKYRTLKYSFDESGISMSWGILFRKEIYLTYRRIQDIHLTRNFVQRWMGLATIGVQTASGSSGPEMSIDGILEAEQLRDFLYSQMRGVQEGDTGYDEINGEKSEEKPEDDLSAELKTLLTEIRDNLKKMVERKEQRDEQAD